MLKWPPNVEQVATIKWYNVWDRVEEYYPQLFLFMAVGPRGPGKTYGALKGIIQGKNGGRFIYLRKTQAVIENACTDALNPFKALNEDMGIDVHMKQEKDFVKIYEGEEHIGYAMALTTFGKIKGTDFRDVNTIIYDEFMEKGVKKVMKDEAFSFFQFYETVNRNREQFGKPPVLALLLGNAETMDNDIITYLRIAEEIHQMKAKKGHLLIDEKRRFMFELVDATGFTEKKKETALYQLTKGGAFYDFAIENEFTNDYFGDVSKLPFNQLTPIVALGNIYFYRDKNANQIYVCKRKANCKRYTKQQVEGFKRDYGYMMMNADDRGRMHYSDYDVKLELEHLLE